MSHKILLRIKHFFYINHYKKDRNYIVYTFDYTYFENINYFKFLKVIVLIDLL